MMPTYRSESCRTYRLLDGQADSFWENGYLGPFNCDAPGIADLPTRVLAARYGEEHARSPRNSTSLASVSDSKINILDPHRDIRWVRETIEHPSIVNRVAQLLRVSEVRYFQSYYRAKFREIEDTVPWHQDIGPRNGGCYPDGTPIPTLTIWMSIDGATKHSGSVQVMPGTHRQPLGEWRKGFSAGLEAGGHLRHLDLSAAVALEAAPFQFYVFQSWIIHMSGTNAADCPRSALVARFVRPEDAVDPMIGYFSGRVL
jgi:ectoine hydroxylase-related dioxygenase (phytanoyl-CoA dioxygenase family)